MQLSRVRAADLGTSFGPRFQLIGFGHARNDPGTSRRSRAAKAPLIQTSAGRGPNPAGLQLSLVRRFGAG